MNGADVDIDAVAEAVNTLSVVSGLSSGRVPEVATYLPNRRIAGVRVTDSEVEIHVKARWGRTLPEVAQLVRAAVAPLVGGRTVSVHVDDIELPERPTPGAETREEP
ncbi:MAG TPA: hypothetical protein VHG90_04720 [Acidimicrobiales bacterium]|nr:hypothetical protein [Acidimicrobiales bacterium]